MWLPILGLLIGLFIGFSSDLHVPQEYSSYLSISVLAALDTVIGGMRAALEHTFDTKIFITGFFFNTLIAAGIVFLGVQLGVDLYLAAIFAFGVRLFNNLAVIRRIILARFTK